MHRLLRISLIIVGFFSLIIVRFLSDKFLEDPLKIFFETNSISSVLPKIDFWTQFLKNSLLFFSNEIISIGILFLFFLDKNVVKFALWFYQIAFVILSISFFVLLEINNPDYNRILFYIRRFLIHPIFLLVLLPAFYFQKKKEI
ncbi:exosortase F system-associated membrane protein [Aureivirga sp. CE67]|uniref:exosortase F system-associated membrane protein n=1 Tax=Aureivirga sp. CE67 TaxID=1788983 RepID=UPI0018CB5CB4|nr:exosortase F system-associated protein [Aureivirga sp. CE67]